MCMQSAIFFLLCSVFLNYEHRRSITVYDPETFRNLNAAWFFQSKIKRVRSTNRRFLGQLQCGRFEYSAGFPYIRGGNSPPPNVPYCAQFFSDLVTGPK